LEGSALKIEIFPRIHPMRPGRGYGLLACKQPGERHQAGFDIAKAILGTQCRPLRQWWILMAYKSCMTLK